MTDEVSNLILERLRRMDDRLSEIQGDMKDMKLRMTAVVRHLLGIQTSIFGLNQRMDRFDERLGRVAWRLDLKDAS